MKQTLFDILVVLALPVLIVVAYYVSTQVSPSQVISIVAGQQGTVAGQTPPGQQTAAALEQLKNIKLDGSVFGYKEFQTLQYKKQNIVQEDVGKHDNPFNW